MQEGAGKGLWLLGWSLAGAEKEMQGREENWRKGFTEEKGGRKSAFQCIPHWEKGSKLSQGSN